MGKQWKQWQALFSWAPKLLQMVTAAMKIKDAPWKKSCDKPQFSSVAKSCMILCNSMDCSTPGFPVHHHSWSLLKLMSIELVMPSNHLILCHSFLLLPSIFPSIRVFPRSQFFTSDGQSIGVSASTLVLPMNIQDSFPLGWTGWISLQSKGLSRVFSNTTAQKHQLSLALLWCSAFFWVQLSHPYMINGKTKALTGWTFVGKVMSLLFNMLSRLV